MLLRDGDVTAAREHCLAALQRDPSDVESLVLMTAIKTRSNPLLGLWWRYNSWLQQAGEARAVVILLVAFVIYRVVTIASVDAGATTVAAGVSVLWLALVVYTWIGPSLFHRALRKELASIQLRSF